MSALLSEVLVAALQGRGLRALLAQLRSQALGGVALGPGCRLRCNRPAQRRACQVAGLLHTAGLPSLRGQQPQDVGVHHGLLSKLAQLRPHAPASNAFHHGHCFRSTGPA